jgi:hypothetical protein
MDWMAVVRAIPTVRHYGRGSYGLNVNMEWMAVAQATPVVLSFGKCSYGLIVNTGWVAIVRFRPMELLLVFKDSRLHLVVLSPMGNGDL